MRPHNAHTGTADAADQREGRGRPAGTGEGQQGPFLQRRDPPGQEGAGRVRRPRDRRRDENPQGGTLTVRDAIIKAADLAKAFGDGRRADPLPARTRRLEDGDNPEGLKIGGAYDPDADEADREQKHPGLLDMFVDRYCRKEAALKSADQYASTFRRLVAPDIGDLPVFEEGRLRRSHIVDMLDEIEDESGPVTADRTLAYMRKAFNWFQARNEDFTNPIVKGMRAVGNNARDRVLSDEELRDLWAALDVVEDVPACYALFVKSLLLTTTRRNEAALMHSSELDGDDWTIPADRYKTGIDHVIPLSDAPRALIGEKPEGAKGNSWFVFTTTGGAKGFTGSARPSASSTRRSQRSAPTQSASLWRIGSCTTCGAPVVR